MRQDNVAILTLLPKSADGKWDSIENTRPIALIETVGGKRVVAKYICFFVQRSQ